MIINIFTFLLMHIVFVICFNLILHLGNNFGLGLFVLLKRYNVHNVNKPMYVVMSRFLRIIGR